MSDSHAQTLSPSAIQEIEGTAQWILDLYPAQEAVLLVTQLAALLERRHSRGKPFDWGPSIAQYRGILATRKEGS